THHTATAPRTWRRCDPPRGALSREVLPPLRDAEAPPDPGCQARTAEPFLARQRPRAAECDRARSCPRRRRDRRRRSSARWASATADRDVAVPGVDACDREGCRTCDGRALQRKQE